MKSYAIEPNTQPAKRVPKTAVLEEWVGPIVVLLAIVPIVVAYYFIGEGLRLDEAQSLWQTSRTISGILAIVAGDVHVPLYHILLHFWRSVFGDSIQVARFFSLFFFVLSIPALYMLAKRAYSTTTALLATLLFAASPFMNWYASEIRMYTLFVFFTILNQYFFIRLFQEKKNRLSIWTLYALTAILGVFSHYFFFLNLLTQAVFFALRYKIFPQHSFRNFAIVGGLILAAFAPWAWYVLFRGVVGFQEPSLFLPSTVDLFNTFSQFFFGFQADIVNTIFLSLWPVAVVFGLIALRRYRRLLPQTEYFAAMVLIPFGIAFLGSRLVIPLFVSRYLIFTVPSFYLVVVCLFSIYPARFRLLAHGTLIALMFLALGVEITNPNVAVKEQYASAVSYLTAHATAQDVILVSAPFTVYPVQYYYRGPAAISTLPQWNQYAFGPIPAFNAEKLPAEVENTTKNYQDVYVLLSYDQGYEKAIKQYFDSHYQRLSAQNFSNNLNLYVYRLRYNTGSSAISTPL